MNTYDRLPEELVEDHARFMAQAPVIYRGYMIKPLSHRSQPYWVKGKFIYWGYNVCDEAGHLNMMPGATWFLTIGSAKTAIDCLHEAGPHPPYSFEAKSREELLQNVETWKAWNDRYWSLMRERKL